MLADEIGVVTVDQGIKGGTARDVLPGASRQRGQQEQGVCRQRSQDPFLSVEELDFLSCPALFPWRRDKGLMLTVPRQR